MLIFWTEIGMRIHSLIFQPFFALLLYVLVLFFGQQLAVVIHFMLFLASVDFATLYFLCLGAVFLF